MRGVRCHPWLQIERPTNRAELEGTYQNWAAALHWLTLVVPLLEESREELKPVLVTLQLAPIKFFSGPVPDDDALDADIVVETGENNVGVRCGDAWQQGARRIDNRAEIALAAALLEGLSRASGIALSRGDALARVREAVPSPDVRWRHAYQPERAADILRLNNILTQPFREISRSAASVIRHGHAFGGDRRPGTVILGKEQCAASLAELHAQSQVGLTDSVAVYDRVELVAMALGMLQACLADEQHWAVTARALRSIHGHDADVRASLQHRSRINAVIRASAMLADVAASHAPLSGGMHVGDMDYDELSATALHHFAYCELVPSLAGDRLTPKFIVSPTGDLLHDHSFGDEALAPSAVAMHAEQRLRHIDEYGRWMTKDPVGASSLEPGLAAALETEFGIPTSSLADFSSGLCDLAIADGHDVLLLHRSVLVQSLCERKGFDAAQLAALVDRLTLPSRSDWNAIPTGAHPNDYDLGRFDRPQSLIGRPLLALEVGDDPLLAIGPAAVERSLLHNLSGALTGSLQDRFWSSKEMRSYVGRAANRAGMAFNDAIADDLRLLGLSADASVAPWSCVNQRATNTIKLLGDIDVLAFSSDRRHVWVIECKDIKLCRTLGETARRLSDYRGIKRRDQKPDNLLRHLDRVAYVRLNAEALANRMRLDTIPEVHGLVVVDTPQPMVFVEPHPSADARFVRRRDLAEVDWTPAVRQRIKSRLRRR